MPIIYHIATVADWDRAHQRGYYEASSLKEEGFIHCSEEWQVANILERYFHDQSDLVKLVIDTDKLGSQLIYEWSPSVADTFPHVYGPINLDSVIETQYIASSF